MSDKKKVKFIFENFVMITSLLVSFQLGIVAKKTTMSIDTSELKIIKNSASPNEIPFSEMHCFHSAEEFNKVINSSKQNQPFHSP